VDVILRHDGGRGNMGASDHDARPMQNEQPPRAHHDMGGLPAGPVLPAEHDYALWEKRVDALMMLLSRRGLLTVDELRRNIEGLGRDAYDRMTYYERWIYAITQTLIERGVISVDELGRTMEVVRTRAAHGAGAHGSAISHG
jgi:hypothetical protein